MTTCPHLGLCVKTRGGARLTTLAHAPPPPSAFSLFSYLGAHGDRAGGGHAAGLAGRAQRGGGAGKGRLGRGQARGGGTGRDLGKNFGACGEAAAAGRVVLRSPNARAAIPAPWAAHSSRVIASAAGGRGRAGGRCVARPSGRRLGLDQPPLHTKKQRPTLRPAPANSPGTLTRPTHRARAAGDGGRHGGGRASEGGHFGGKKGGKVFF